MSFTNVTLTGTLLNTAEQAVANATVSLQLSAPITDGITLIEPTLVSTSTSSNGTFSLGPVPANDDPTTSPTGTSYTVTITAGSWTDTWSVIVPHAGGTSQDLFSLAPLSPPKVPAEPYVSTLQGLNGAITLTSPNSTVTVGTSGSSVTLESSTNATALQGVAVSTTAPTSGQVLEYNGTAWAPATGGGGGGTGLVTAALTIVSANTTLSNTNTPNVYPILLEATANIQVPRSPTGNGDYLRYEISQSVVTSLTTALVTTSATASLAVTALTAAIPSGATVTTVYGSNTQSWVLSAAAAAGATSLSVNSQTANYAYPVGTRVIGPGSGFVPTLLDNAGASVFWADSIIPSWATGNGNMTVVEAFPNEGATGWVFRPTSSELVGYLLAANNLSDVANPAQALKNLGGAPDTAQVFTASGTWAKPSNGTFAKIVCIGGGGGGGGGALTASGTACSGGGGGSGGGYSEATVLLSDLPTSVTVTVGAGGAGGAASTTASTAGGNGAAGASSTFGSILGASGGSGGQGAQVNANSAGGATGGEGIASGVVTQGQTGAGGTNGAAGSAPTSGTGLLSTPGGGSGAGLAATSPAGLAGGAGGTIAPSTLTQWDTGGAGGAAGASGANGSGVFTTKPGGGGGGGGSNTSGTAGNGGAGGIGAGGGGGGSNLNTFTAGAGGAGGGGLVAVFTW